MSTKPNEEKQFSLKEIELRVIGNINERNNAELVDMLSFIALERLNYDVTDKTQFRVDGEGKLYISEREEQVEEEVIAA